MKLRWDSACVWHLGLFLTSTLVAFVCFRFLPNTIEGFRLYSGNGPLLLTSDLLMAKQLAQLSCWMPVLFAVLFVVSLFTRVVVQPRIIQICGFMLAAFYGIFIFFLGLSLNTALHILMVFGKH